jgi:hypothetical protein
LKAQLRKLEQRLSSHEAARRRENASMNAPVPRGSNAMVVKGDIGGLYPDRFYYKGIEITPGGYFAMGTVYRSRWLGADTATNFSTIPYGNSAAGHTSEFRMTARQTQLSMRVDANVNPATHLGAYVEIDFLGAAQTANSNQTNSYNPRIRHLYSTVDMNDIGVHFLAGQTWSLNTLGSKGIRPDAVATPPVMDGNLMVGFTYKRNPQLRLEKDIGKEVSVALSVEGAATTFATSGPAATELFPTATTGIISPGGFAGAPVLTATPASGGLFNSANAYSLNRLPDFIGKVAWDPAFAGRDVHFEAFGLLHDISDRVYWGNHSAWGSGVGGGVVVAALPKLLDLQASGMVGRGIGQYAPALLPDSAYSVTGSPQPIHERVINVGATVHVTPQTDVFMFAGGEFDSAQAQSGLWGKSLVLGGYGNQFYDNSGCDLDSGSGPLITGLSTNCAGQVKAVRQLWGGVWHTLYQGPFGKVRAGIQYSYEVKDAFPGIGATPKATENTVYTSFRYYPF